MVKRKVSSSKRSVLIVDPAGGLAGDMFLAGLLALGAEAHRVEGEVRSLPGLERFSIALSRKRLSSIVAHRASIECSPARTERDLSSVLRMIERSRLGHKERELSKLVFRILAEAEARVHGTRLERVHFHEIGAVDSIVDIVGSVVALSHLGYPDLYHLPFVLARGFVSTSHGKLPLPAPATMEILRGRTIRFSAEEGETVTPTGAALMKALARELPRETSFKPMRIVYSCGTRESGGEPGLLRLIYADAASIRHPISLIRTTIDDMNPQIYGHLFELLFSAGALEVYLTQVLMKKGRPGVELNVLCDAERVDALLETIFRETTTLGARVSVEAREELERWIESVGTPYGIIEVKKARLSDGTLKVAPEFESCKRAARKFGVALSIVAEAARSSSVGSRRAEKETNR